MEGMFEAAQEFEQNLSAWDVSNVTSNSYFGDKDKITLPNW
jgi:surface protein